MDVAFRDRLLTCAECGTQFVYTVGQQRQSHEEHGEVQDPQFCPVCEVKLERQGRLPAGDEERNGYATNGGYNGSYDSYSESYSAPANGGDHRYAAGQPMERPTSQPNGALSTAQPLPPVEGTEESEPSTGKPLNYQTGEAHPLYGHNGEQRMGYVKWFNDRKGFGFITLDDGNELFVHYSGISGEGYKTLKQGQRVQLVVEDTDKGPQASHVEVVDEQPGEGPTDF